MTLKEFAIELQALRDEAKALWGEGENRPKQGFNLTNGKPMTTDQLPKDMSLWKRHLQQLLIADDPVKYLKEHSKGEQ